MGELDLPPSVTGAPDAPANRRASWWRRPWLLAAVWASAIFGLSSLPGSRMPSVDLPGLDKIVHAVLYATLGALVARALTATRALRGGAWKVVAAATVLAVGYGATDELHQLFVAGRSADVRDLAADAVGAVLGAACAVAIHRRLEKRRTLW